MLIEKVKIEKIKCAEYNPRKDLQETDKKYNEIKNSLETFETSVHWIWENKTIKGIKRKRKNDVSKK